MTQDHTTSAPTCYRHPDRHTLLSCSRCGKPICAECSIDASVGQRCPQCVSEEGVQRVVPTRANMSRSTRDAPATRVIIVVTVIMFFLSGMGTASNGLFDSLAQYSPALDAGQWWRIFTVVLLHAGLTHILFNMWALWVLGPQIERGVGTAPFVALYLASAGMGGVVAYYLGGPNDVAVGASGAIFGLFGIWISWALHRRNTAAGRAMLGQLGFLLLINAAIPFIVPGISWQAHLGGLITGFVIGELWSRVRGANATQVRTAIAGAVAVLAAALVLI